MSEDFVRLTPDSLTRARELASEMINDRVIRPLTGDAVFYEDYQAFRATHRIHWERSWRFEEQWQPQIFALATLEAARNGIAAMDNATHWRLWHSMIFSPIKNALWEEWENLVNLEECYHDAVLRSRSMAEHRRTFCPARPPAMQATFPRWTGAAD